MPEEISLVTKESQRYLDHLQTIVDAKEYVISGESFLILPGVMLPGPVTEFFAGNMPFVRDGRFLEIGSSHGIHSILAYKKAGMTGVATDISSECAECIKQNISRHGLQEKIQVGKGDMFQVLDRMDKYDVIFFYPPIHGEKPDSMMERLITDENHNAIKTYLREGGYFLRKDGFLCLGYGDNGNVKLVEDEIEKNGWGIQDVVKLYRNGFHRLFYILRMEQCR